MKIVVDTSVWSLVLRRDRVDEANTHVRALRACVAAGHLLLLLGPILLELLDSLASSHQFARLLNTMDPIPFLALNRSTYVLAARIRNDCRRKGIQASTTDFLIAAACVESGCPLLTADKDFERIAGCNDLVLIQL